MPLPKISRATSRGHLLGLFLCLVGVLAVLFHRSFGSDEILFNNDLSFGAYMALVKHGLGIYTGYWQDLNWLGGPQVTPPPSVSSGLGLIVYGTLGPTGFFRFFPPLCLTVLGLSAGLFFRQLGFGSTICALGGLAAALNMNIFSNACWGQTSRAMTMAMTFLALAALTSRKIKQAWLRHALAGLAIGMGVMEGFDTGAIFSLYVAAFAFFLAWQTQGAPAQKIVRGVGRVAMMAGCAVFIAAHILISLFNTQVKGVAGTQQDQQTKLEQWDWATSWSFPKLEMLRVIIPGSFGYRMDAPEGGNYWGGVGPISGGQQVRHSGSGEYAGVLVVLGALWALVQSARKKASAFSQAEKNIIWFWGGAALVSMLFAWGRNAPFYKLIYALPYFSTIRMPIKFLHPFHLSLLILFAFGVQSLFRSYVNVAAGKTVGLKAHLASWWAKAAGFEKKCGWTFIFGAGASLLGWLLYAASRSDLERHLKTVGFDLQMAPAIARFSIGEVGLFVFFLILSLAALAVILSGAFAGVRAKWAGILLGLLLVVDLGRADAHWITYFNYQEKYVDNPILNVLRQEPYQQRVSALSFNVPQELAGLQQSFQQIYHVEWKQHLFQYHSIQSLDIIQQSRTPEDFKAFESAFQAGPPETIHRIARRWQLTNTRYLIGLSSFLEPLNQQIDPLQKRFRIHSKFDFSQNSPSEPILTQTNAEGRFALFEFAGVLPRAKLYAHWQTTNDSSALPLLASPAFDPEQTVLLANPLPVPSPSAVTRPFGGSVSISKYSPRFIQLKAKTEVPAVLLLNDKYDSNWNVTVNGRPETLLRCNYIMRGVLLQPGEQTIEFRFQPPVHSLYVSLTVVLLGLAACGWLAFSRPQSENTPATYPATKSI